MSKDALERNKDTQLHTCFMPSIHLAMSQEGFKLQRNILSKFTHPESGFRKGETRLQL